MVDRADLNAYLLHEMPETERNAFAERWFTEPDLYQELQMAEADLLDAYARGSLSRSQRIRVERYLLASEHQSDKLAFARGLKTALPEPRRGTLTFAAFAAAAAMIFVLAGTAAWLGFRNRDLTQQIAVLRRPVPVSGGVYAVELSSGTLRGPAPQISVTLPHGTSLVRMELELEPGQEQETYSATVLRAGQIVWAEAPLHSERRGQGFLVKMWMPEKVLTPGSYTIRLAVGDRPAAYYAFIVAP